MATVTTTFASWQDLENTLIRTQDYRQEYGALHAYSIIELSTRLFRPSSITPYSETYAEGYSPGYHYYFTGAGLISSYTPTVYSVSISDTSKRMEVSGAVTFHSNGQVSGQISSVRFSEGIYQNWTTNGAILPFALSGTFSRWGESFRFDDGEVTYLSSGSRTTAANGTGSASYSSYSVSVVGTGSIQIDGCSFTSTLAQQPDQLELLTRLLSGNDRIVGIDGSQELRGMAGNDTLARIFHKTGRISLNPLIKLGLRQ